MTTRTRAAGDPPGNAVSPEQIHLLLFGAEPLHLGVRQDVIEDHDPAGDERRTGLPPVPILRLAEGAIDGAGLQVIDVAAVRPLCEGSGKPAGCEETCGTAPSSRVEFCKQLITNDILSCDDRHLLSVVKFVVKRSPLLRVFRLFPEAIGPLSRFR